MLRGASSRRPTLLHPGLPLQPQTGGWLRGCGTQAAPLIYTLF
jgi:hypothetical protein